MMMPRLDERLRACRIAAEGDEGPSLPGLPASVSRKGMFDMANDKPKVGFIGLGNMGIGMARNIAAAGLPLTF